MMVLLRCLAASHSGYYSCKLTYNPYKLPCCMANWGCSFSGAGGPSWWEFAGPPGCSKSLKDSGHQLSV